MRWQSSRGGARSTLLSSLLLLARCVTAAMSLSRQTRQAGACDPRHIVCRSIRVASALHDCLGCLCGMACAYTSCGRGYRVLELLMLLDQTWAHETGLAVYPLVFCHPCAPNVLEFAKTSVCCALAALYAHHHVIMYRYPASVLDL